MSSLFNHFEKRLMKQLLQKAATYRGKTGRNPMVAAAIYDDHKRIISLACHEKQGEAHAEIKALNLAGSKAENAHIMITLEPCTHTGLTPPCVQALIKAKLRRVVYAVKDPNPLVKKNPAHDILKSAGIEVVCDLLEDEAKVVNEVFFTNQLKQRPFVSLKMGCSIDGKIAPSNKDSRYITHEKSLKQVHRLRREHHAILVGLGTVLQDNPRLDVRHGMLRSGYYNPLKIIIDPLLNTPIHSALLQKNKAIAFADQVIFVCQKHVSNSALSQLPYVRFWPLIEHDGHLNWDQFLKKCYNYGICSVLIEGGQHVFSTALAARVVDRLEIFMAPLIIAGSDALSPFSLTHFLSLDHAIKLKSMQVKNCKPDIWIRAHL